MTLSARETPSWVLTGFGDEIDPDPHVQCAVLLALGANHIEVRSAWETNIVELTDEQLYTLRDIINNAGMGVSAIASPIGKSNIDAPLDDELARLDRALTAARVLGARYIRIFSFWQSAERPVAAMRDAVIERLAVFAERAQTAGVILVHENEKDIYGDTPERVLDLITGVNSPALRVAWDNANFVQVGVRPYTDGFALLAPHIEYLQVKDARIADGAVVPAGDGDGELADTINALRDAGYGGFASLEPHLTDAHALGGFTGPEGYGRAARAFRSLTDHAGVTLV